MQSNGWNRDDASLRVLLVDDEKALCVTLARAMSDRYEIVCETTTGGALRRLERDHDFHAILCDLNMPDEPGMVLYERLARRWPGMERRVVFITGGSLDETTTSFLRNIPNSCLEKPFNVSTLERLIESKVRAPAAV